MPPTQAAPVERLYMRPLVGKKGKQPATGTGAAANRTAIPPHDGDYLVEVLPFYARRGRR